MKQKFAGIRRANFEAISFGCGWIWKGWGDVILFFCLMLGVNIGVRVVEYGIDVHTAMQINEQIQKRKSRECKKGDLSDGKN